MAQTQHEELIQILHDCAAACNYCFTECLKEDNVKMMAECIRLDRECADTCAFTEQAASRNSEFLPQLAQFCADVCKACGDECAKHADKHEHCKVCAEACRRCEEACRSVA